MKITHYFPVVTVLLVIMAQAVQSADIYVHGTVVDSSDNPIPEAMVIVRIMMGATDTLFTNTDGQFAKVVETNQNSRRIRYDVSKEGYTSATGMGDVVQDTADLDTITIILETTPIKSTVQNNFQKVPDKILIYSISGKLLYAGPKIAFNKIRDCRISNSQPLIACYSLDNTILYNVVIKGAGVHSSGKFILR